MSICSAKIVLILMPLVLMLLLTYYCQNYAAMIGTSLFFMVLICLTLQPNEYLVHDNNILCTLLTEITLLTVEYLQVDYH